MIVFWCDHAYSSREIKKEYRRAIKLGKAVVPILLDFTRLPKDLAQYQAIDLRPALGSHSGGEGEPFVLSTTVGINSGNLWNNHIAKEAGRYLLEKLGELGAAQKVGG